ALATITWKIVLPGTVASTMGAALCYYIALWGGKVFVERFHGYLGFSWGDIERMSHRMRTSGVAATIFFMRALPIVPLSLVSMVCGVADVPSRTFLVWTVLGTIPRCYILGILGWQLGSSAMAWARGVNRFESVISLTIVLAVFGGIFYLRRRLRKDVQEG
ncbi:MAG TPA: VTT domain-containing protein, partial [Elusimicrobiota bacterium]|nr:VTT domain-containing protein [Elusimicrobiota bacterium]